MAHQPKQSTSQNAPGILQPKQFEINERWCARRHARSPHRTAPPFLGDRTFEKLTSDCRDFRIHARTCIKEDNYPRLRVARSAIYSAGGAKPSLISIKSSLLLLFNSFHAPSFLMLTCCISTGPPLLFIVLLYF